MAVERYRARWPAGLVHCWRGWIWKQLGQRWSGRPLRMKWSRMKRIASEGRGGLILVAAGHPLEWAAHSAGEVTMTGQPWMAEQVMA